MKRSRSTRRGAALIETVIALGVLGIGTAAVVMLVKELNQAGTKSAFHTASLNLFAAFAAQVRAASCDVAPGSVGFQATSSDLGLAPTGTPNTAPVDPRSAVQLVGDFIDATQIQGAPPLRLTYTVRNAATAFADAPPSLEVHVQIREITRDPAKDNA